MRKLVVRSANRDSVDLIDETFYALRSVRNLCNVEVRVSLSLPFFFFFFFVIRLQFQSFFISLPLGYLV